MALLAAASAIWKFGYGSNMSQDFLRIKKRLNPIESRRTVLHGFTLSFPEGRGIDFVEPAFATLKRYPRCSNKAGATHVCPHAPRVTRSVVS